MTKPLTIKRPGVTPIPTQIILVLFVGGPLAGLWYCQKTGRDVHVDDPWLNLAVYLGIFLVPVMWAFFLSYRRFEFAETEEISLGYNSAWDKESVHWWTMFVMWAAPVYAVWTLTYHFSTQWLRHPETLYMSPGRALLVMVVTLCVGMFYVTLLLARSENESHLAPEGLRTSLLRFHAWADLHHFSQRGELFTIYHRVNPALPAACFKVRDPQTRALLEKALADHQVAASDVIDPQLTSVRIGVVAGFVAILLGSFWLQLHTTISGLWITVMAFGAGIIFTLLLERLRGISKFGKSKPIVEPSPDGIGYEVK